MFYVSSYDGLKLIEVSLTYAKYSVQANVPSIYAISLHYY